MARHAACEARRMPAPSPLAHAASWSPTEIVARSLFPFVALALLALVPLLGAYVFALLVVVWWRVVTRLG